MQLPIDSHLTTEQVDYIKKQLAVYQQSAYGWAQLDCIERIGTVLRIKGIKKIFKAINSFKFLKSELKGV